MRTKEQIIAKAKKLGYIPDFVTDTKVVFGFSNGDGFTIYLSGYFSCNCVMNDNIKELLSYVYSN